MLTEHRHSPYPGPLHPLDVRPDNIWHYAQNRLSLVMADLRILFGVPEREALLVLVARGVGKWLAVRRDLIRAQHAWRDRETETLLSIRAAKRAGDRDELARLRGYLAALQECRGTVRALCHSGRWRIPDHDRRAARLLEAIRAGRRRARNGAPAVAAEAPTPGARRHGITTIEGSEAV